MATENSSKGTTGGSGWAGGLVAFVIVGALMKSCSGSSKKPTPPSPPPPSSPTGGNLDSPPASGQPMRLARLSLSARDGTEELQAMAARLPRSEAIALGLGAFLTGTDTYAAKVRIANTGTVPIRVYPENLVVHFGAETAVVSTINHPRFLQRVVLEPGFEVEGLVTYEARIDIGAAMRLGAGSFSYLDDTVVVTYGR